MSEPGERGERGERFTDEELAFLRYARFGELPARVRPEDLVEVVDADRPAQLPPEPIVRPEWIGG